MTEFTLPYFGKLSSDNLEEYYDVDIDFKGSKVQVDLNFENNSIDRSTVDTLKNFIENIEKFDKLNKVYILNDYHDEEGDTVKFYMEHHLQEMEEDELSALIDFENKTIDPEQQLLAKLELVRIGLYPDSEDSFAIFDYSIGEDITNYLVVINTDASGQLAYMTMES